MKLGVDLLTMSVFFFFCAFLSPRRGIEHVEKLIKLGFFNDHDVVFPGAGQDGQRAFMKIDLLYTPRT